MNTFLSHSISHYSMMQFFLAYSTLHVPPTLFYSISFWLLTILMFQVSKRDFKNISVIPVDFNFLFNERFISIFFNILFRLPHSSFTPTINSLFLTEIHSHQKKDPRIHASTSDHCPTFAEFQSPKSASLIQSISFS